MNEDEIKKILNDIYEGLLSIRFLPLNLYLFTANKLLSGVYQGYGYTLTELVEKQIDAKALRNLATNIYPLVEVKDLSSAYPTSITALNTSKETTKHEYIRLEGAHTSPDNVLKQNMNIFNGAVNALDYCIHVYGFSPLEEVDKIIQSL
jgi:hypothetical protein